MKRIKEWYEDFGLGIMIASVGLMIMVFGVLSLMTYILLDIWEGHPDSLIIKISLSSIILGVIIIGVGRIVSLFED